MRHAWAPAIALAILALPTSARAQFRPTITVPIDQTGKVTIGITDLEENTSIGRTWSASVDETDTYKFELTYDQISSGTTALDLVDLEEGANKGTVFSGQNYTFVVKPKQVLKGIIDANNQPVAGKNLVDTRKLVLRVFRSANRNDNDFSAQHEFEFDYDLDPPDAPKLTAISAGENRLEVTWDAPAGETVASYEVLYFQDLGVGASCETTVDKTKFGLPTTASAAAALLDKPEDFPSKVTEIGASQRRFSVSTSLVNDVCAAVSVRAVDEAGNRGAMSNVAVGRPINVLDFFELSRVDGGGEDGGFCFIATAAHGSYAHPAVRVLRWFRDGVLKRTPIGTALVWTYYRLSPPLAREIRGDPALAALTRLALVPVTLIALACLLAPALGLALLLVLLLRRVRPRAGVVAGLGLALLLVGARAEASERRPEPARRVSWGFFFRGGPYLPDMAEDGGKGSFSTVFGPTQTTEADANPLFGLGLDLTLFRGFGQLGIGAGWGFMQFVGRGLTNAQTRERSNDTTVFNLMPLELVAFYRFSVLNERFDVPIIPYLRGGLAYDVWWVTNGIGDISRSTVNGVEAKGYGGKLGLVGTLGLAVELNWLDPTSARKLAESAGIDATSLFAELAYANVDGFGSAGFDLSELTWNVGIYFDF